MLDASGKQEVDERAYLPEHLPKYLIPFSQLEPVLTNDYLAYVGAGVVNVIGYPLRGDFSQQDILQVVEELVKKYQPQNLRIMAPEWLEIPGFGIERREEDSYSSLLLNEVTVTAKTRNMLVRAGRELTSLIGESYTMEHQRLLQQFIQEKQLDEETSDFFHLLPDYLTYSPTATLIEARSKATGELVGFNVLESSEGDWGFYLFNITLGGKNYIPGTADLLVEKMIVVAKEQGKTKLNMGLGINPGIATFKAKWGAKNFYPYRFMAFVPKLSFSSFLCFLRKK